MAWNNYCFIAKDAIIFYRQINAPSLKLPSDSDKNKIPEKLW